MFKNHHSQYRPNPQTQVTSVSSTYSYTLDDGGRSTPQPVSMSSNEPEDDDDICPVCESECTCANRTRSASSLSSNIYLTGSTSQDVTRKNDGNASPSSGPPTLKIRLTLPPRLQQHSASSSSKSSNARQSSYKKKVKSVIDTACTARSLGEGTGHLSTALTEPHASTSAYDVQLNAGGTIPKKRGRPSKAVVAAREAAKKTSEAKHPSGGTGQSIRNVVVARRSAPLRAPQDKLFVSAKKKGKKLHGAAAASRARAQQRKTYERVQHAKGRRKAVIKEDESSELSELDDDDEIDDLHPFGLPTFVSALSSSSNSSSSDSGSDTDTDSDKGARSFPRLQETSSSFLGGNEHAQHNIRHHNKWDIRVRKRSVGAGETSDADMETDSGEEEEDEDDDDDDNEADADDNDEDAEDTSVPQFIRYSGIATGWTDDEESSFDADLFFANLSDSTAEVSDDEQLGDEEVGFGQDEVRDEEMSATNDGFNTAGLDMMRLSEVAAAGFLAPFSDLDRGVGENLHLGQGWDHLSLSTAFKDSLLDFDVQTSRRLPLGSSLELPIPGYEDADAVMATSEEEEAVAMFDNCSQDLDEDDGVEIFEDSDGGETTEDEFVDVDGVATPRHQVLLRFPASLGAIDPMSTVSSPIRGPIGHERTSSTISRPLLKPIDILSRKVKVDQIKEDSVSGLPDGSSRESSSVPSMGTFAPQASDESKRVVISSSGGTSGRVIPCPYPAVRRLRGRGRSVSTMSRSGSDLAYHSRTPSLLAAVRSPHEVTGCGDFDSFDDAQLPPAEPIQLDDVIDTTLLESERSDFTVPESTASQTDDAIVTCESESDRDRHIQNLRRWDHIPIDAFRKTRAAGAGNDLVVKMNAVVGTPRAPRPSDGFSYGSSVGGMLRGSPLNTTLWESGNIGARSQPGTEAGNTERRGKLSCLLVSPVLLPIRDEDRTPTAEHLQQNSKQQYLGHASQHAAYTAQNIKSRKELRKEKKRTRKFFGSPASHIRHNHFPNAKSRSSGSMQRSSIPSLTL